MAASDKTDFRLQDFLPYQLSVASNAVSNQIAQVYKDEFGLRIAEWRVMAMLGDAGTLTQRELAERTLMDKVAVNRACKQLEKRGLIMRRPNSADGRSHLLALTSKGKQMHRRIVPKAVQIEQEMLAKIDPRFDLDAFRDLLGQLRKNAGAQDGDD